MSEEGLRIRHKKEYRWIGNVILFVMVVAVGVSGWLAYRWYTTGDLPPFITVSALGGNDGIDESEVSLQQRSSHEVALHEPRYLSIPSLDIEQSRIFGVDVDENNMLEDPANIHDIAWYEKSATPGAGYGAILLNGRNDGVSKDGVFANLKNMKVGEEIIIQRGDDKSLTYKVVENDSMTLDEVNSSGVKKMTMSADPSKEGLNIITYDGKWVPKLQQYDRRIMLRSVITE